MDCMTDVPSNPLDYFFIPDAELSHFYDGFVHKGYSIHIHVLANLVALYYCRRIKTVILIGAVFTPFQLQAQRRYRFTTVIIVL